VNEHSKKYVTGLNPVTTKTCKKQLPEEVMQITS
jgi:hypothetical protein